MIDFDKLVQDLIVGKQIAEYAAQGDDGGSCNLDHVYIHIPKIREATVKNEFLRAGLHANKSTYWGSPAYAIGGFKSGQGDSNYRAVQALYEYLKKCNWDVGVWYQMD